jgi:hypothetical protein
MGADDAVVSNGNADTGATDRPSGDWWSIINTLANSGTEPEQKPQGPSSDLNVVSTIRSAIAAAGEDRAWQGGLPCLVQLQAGPGTHLPSTCHACRRYRQPSAFLLIFVFLTPFAAALGADNAHLMYHGVVCRLWGGGAPAERARHRIAGGLRRRQGRRPGPDGLCVNRAAQCACFRVRQRCCRWARSAPPIPHLLNVHCCCWFIRKPSMRKAPAVSS